MAVLPVAEYLPDIPDFPGSGSDNIRNVYPRTPVSYGAIGAPMPISSALSARCQGACAFLSTAGDVNLFAGDTSKLYRVRAGDAYVWQDVSKVGGYHVDPEDMWEFDHFNGSIIAANLADNIQTFDLMADTVFSDLSANAPRAKHISVIKNAFLVTGYTFDGVDGTQPQRVWWSAAGDAASWPTPGSTLAAQLQSGFVNLLGDDGAIQAIRSGLTAADGLVFQQYGIRRMVYVGPPLVFDLLPAQNARGTPAPYSPIVVGGNCYFLGYDGFYSCDGSSAVPIGANKVDKTFFADLDARYVDRVVGTADPASKMIWWAYPGAQSMGGAPNHLIGYNWQLERWAIVDVECETLARMIGIGYSLDELFTVLGYTLDTLPASLDSSIWAGGSLQLGLFDLNHKLNYLTGPILAPTVTTSEMQPFPGKRALVRGARPLVDGTAIGTPSIAIGHRERLQDAVIYTLAAPLNRLGNCPVRTSGRYLRASTTIAAGGDWTNISGIDIDAAPQGQR